MTKLIDVFNSSFERVLGREKEGQMTEEAEEFFKEFYSRFLTSSPQVKHVFRNTDMDKQRYVLKTSLYLLVYFYVTQTPTDNLSRLAVKHNKQHHNIPPELYGVWEECLVRTLQEFDPEFNASIELSWRTVLAPGIAFMKTAYNYPDELDISITKN